MHLSNVNINLLTKANIKIIKTKEKLRPFNQISQDPSCVLLEELKVMYLNYIIIFGYQNVFLI